MIKSGGGNYKRLVKFSSVFSDKSLFIKEITESSFDTILITMPRRWGKSTNLDMLRRFVGIQVDNEFNLINEKEKGNNYRLFFERPDNKDPDVCLYISQTEIQIETDEGIKSQSSKDLCCTKPVIFLNLKDCQLNSYKLIKDILKDEVINLYERQHKYLGRSSNPDIIEKYHLELKNLKNSSDEYAIIKGALKLIELIYDQFVKKVWILIDEYDSPINHALLKFKDKDIENTISLFRGFYQILLKDNPNVEKGVLTGVLCIAQLGFFSGLNNLGKFSIDNPQFSKYYGLKEDEIQKFLDHFNISQTQSDEIKKWYNGFKIKLIQIRKEI